MPATGIVRITDTLLYIAKEFALLKTTSEDDLQQEIEDIIEIMQEPPKTIPLRSYRDATKMRSIRLITFYSKVQLSLAWKFYHCLQCYHRVRIKLSCHQTSPTHLYQIRGCNRLCNLRGWKHWQHHPHYLRGRMLQHTLARTPIKIHWFFF